MHERPQARPLYVTAVSACGKSNAASDSAALSEIRVILGLSENELADIFHVRRESIAGWRKTGIPDARRASVARVFDMARLLHRDLKPDRIAEIVRTHDAWLERGTILETLKLDGPDPIYSYLRRLFSYSR